MAVFLINHVSEFYMELCVSNRFYIKYTYMIGRKHNHVVLPDHASISPNLFT